MSTTPNIDSTAPLVYKPALPLQPSWTSVMSQDIVSTDAILVDSTSTTPVAAFTNLSSGQAEALVVANLSRNDETSPQLCHVARNAATHGGWSLVPLFGGRIANEVAAGTAFANTYGFFNDDNGLYYTQLQADGATWTEPQTILQGSTNNLKVAYSPAGRIVLYGNTAQGDLMTVYQEQLGGPFVSTICAMQAALVQGDFYLCMTDEPTWNITTNVNGQPWVYTGVIGADEFSSLQQVSDFQGTLKQVVLGYWSDTQNTLMFLLVDTDNALHVWSTNSTNSTAAVQPIPNSTVTAATGHVSSDQTLHVYSVDKAMNLWALHQDKDNPWNDDGTPNWSPYIPLDTQVAALASDMNPADAPSLFVRAAADNALRLHAQDPLTGMWRSGQVLQDSEEAFEVVRFRTEVTLFDSNGVALSGYPVTLSSAEGCSGTEISVAGSNYPVDSQSSVSLTTDNAGKVTMSTLTNAGIGTPNLIMNANGLPAPITIQPAGPIHNYLAGQGQLNLTNPGGPLPTFDKSGSTLTTATVNGSPLAPGAQGNSTLAGIAASAIQNTAQVGLGQQQTSIAGYSFSISGPQGLSFKIHQTTAEVDAQLAQMPTGELGSVWNDIEKWAGDVWEGIKNGLIKITGALVNVVDKVVSFTAQMGDTIINGAKLALKGIEQAAHFIVGVFQAVEAKLASLIDWLKAMFDFGAIWHTKKVFEEGLRAVPAYLKQLVDAGQGGADNWFSEKEREVSAAFDQLKASFTGRSFADLPNLPQLGQPPSNQTKVVGNATPADFSNNVHHNWLQDKVSSNAPPDFGISPNNDVVNLWTSNAPKIMAAAQDFVSALTDFKNGITSTIENPKSFGSVAIPDFLDALKKLINSMLNFCDAALDLFLGIARLALDAAGTLLATPLQLGFLNKLWKWIAEQAGDPSDDELTLGAVIALMAAFPATVVYKLIEGADSEPFPDGKPPWQSSAGMLSAGAVGTMPKNCLIMAGILQVLYVVPWAIGDYDGPAAPGYLSFVTMGMTALIWVLTHGLPDISMLLADLGVATLVVAAALVVLGAFPTIVNAIKAAIVSFLAGALNDPLIIFWAFFGIARIVLFAISGVTDNEQLLIQILLSLPFIMGVLNLSVFRDDILAPLFIGTVLVFDVAGFVGGGILELIDVSTSSLQAAAAEPGRG